MMHQHPINYFSTYHYFNCVKVKPHRPHSCCPRRVYCQEIKCQSHLDISMDKLEDTKIAKNYRSLREVHCLLLYSIRICGEELITTAPQWWDSRMPGHSLGTTTKKWQIQILRMKPIRSEDFIQTIGINNMRRNVLLMLDWFLCACAPSYSTTVKCQALGTPNISQECQLCHTSFISFQVSAAAHHVYEDHRVAVHETYLPAWLTRLTSNQKFWSLYHLKLLVYINIKPQVFCTVH